MQDFAVRIVTDASSIINLHTVGALDVVCGLSRCHLWLSPAVVGECQPSCAAKLLDLKAHERVGFVDDTRVPADLFLKLLVEHKLGEGETKLIAVCLVLGYHLCSDDKRARSLAKQILGGNRVVGSLRLLRWCVEEGLIDCAEAFRLFREMRSGGGFLPDTARPFFCSGSVAC